MLEIKDLSKRYGDVVALDGATLHRPARPARRLPRPQRRRQDDDDALHLRPRDARPRRRRLARPADRPGDSPPLRLHARAARPLPADERRRAAQLLRPAARDAGAGGGRGDRPLARPAGPRRPRAGQARGAVARQPAARPARARRSSTTRSCSSSTSRSRGLDPIGIATMTEILRERAAAGVGGRLLQPPARPRRGRLRGRRDHRPRPDRRRRRDRRAAGGVGPAPPRGRGRGRRQRRGSTAAAELTIVEQQGRLRPAARPGRRRPRRRCSPRRPRPDRSGASRSSRRPSRSSSWRRSSHEPRDARSGSSPGARSSSAAGAGRSSSRSSLSVVLIVAGIFLPKLIGGEDQAPASSGVVGTPPAGSRAGPRRRPPAQAAADGQRRVRAGRRDRRGAPQRRARSTRLLVVPADRLGSASSSSRSATTLVRPGRGIGVVGRVGEPGPDRRGIDPATGGRVEAADAARARAVRPEPRHRVHLRQRRRDPPVHRDLHVRDVGPDRGRRGEAEPRRRGRPLDRRGRATCSIGKVLGIGLLGLVQLVIMIVVGLAIGTVTGRFTLPPTTGVGGRDAAALVRPRLRLLLDGAGRARRARVADGGGVERVEPGLVHRDRSPYVFALLVAIRTTRRGRPPGSRRSSRRSRRWSCRSGRRSARSSRGRSSARRS